jgi:hypothetical protein
VVLTSSSEKTMDLSETIPANEIVREHQHNLENVPIDGKINCDFKFTHVNNTNKGEACHGTIGTNRASHKYDI